MASTKRKAPGEEKEPGSKKVKVIDAAPSDPQPQPLVVLNHADCDLDFNIEGNGLQGSALYENGFAYCWSGARANVGITGGKYCFGCKIVSVQPVDMEDTPVDQQHISRVGISIGDDPVGNLGETKHSFGFGGTGKFSNAGKFTDYGEKYEVGDTIVCAVNLEVKPLAFVGFSKNGKWLGTAWHFNAGPDGLGVVDSTIRKLPWESALFPHVMLKNVIVHLQFCPDDGLVPEDGYKPWASALEDGNALIGPSFSNQEECEVMMMVGLPASGKTTWAEKWVKEHPDKRYVLLGTNLALDQMKVPGLLRKHNYGERFDRLMDRATGIFNTLLARAAKTPRNYIIDQTNVYKSARKRKLKPFANYKKIAVVIFPKAEELKFRSDKRFKEMGKEVPAEAVNEMIVNYVLPTSKEMHCTDEYFDEVVFPELNRGEAQRVLDEMKQTLVPGRDVHSQKGTAPYSRESSIQSYNGSSMRYQEVSGYSPYGSASGGQWRSYNSPQPQPPLNYAYQRLLEVSSAYCGIGQSGRTNTYSAAHQGSPTLPASGAPYRSYQGQDHSWMNDTQNRITDPGMHSGPHHAYGVSTSYIRPDMERTSFPASESNPYQHGMIGPYIGPPYDGHGEQTSFREPVGYRVDPQAPRPSTFLPPPTAYGSPYGTPTARPPYRNYSPDMQHAPGHFPPRPWY